MSDSTKQILDAISLTSKELNKAIEADRQQLDVLIQEFKPKLRAIEEKLDRMLERFRFLVPK